MYQKIVFIAFIYLFLDNVGCFNLPHKNSPLQKVPEDPKLLDTKFYLFTTSTDFSKPEIVYYDDDGKSLDNSSFNFSKPVKLISHGYMSKWNEKGSIILANTYLKLVSTRRLNLKFCKISYIIISYFMGHT